jgi:uncharacterized protein
MIRNSFIFLERISKKKEQNIWQQGIKDWQDFLKKDYIKSISKIKKHYYNRKIQEAQKAIFNNNSSYFINNLPKIEMWRLYNKFKEESCFLDIEVDSLGKIILVGISNNNIHNYDNNNNNNTKFFVKGINLEKNNLEKELEKYKIIVTFNGSSFDLPKIKKEFKIKINQPHIDLKPLCINLGLKGGLKEVEKKLNLRRPPHLNGNPVNLWKAFHASGDKEYLDLLLDYNREDCENLKSIINYFIQNNPLNIKR